MSKLAYMQIFGMPAVAYGGMLTFACIVLTAAIPILRSKGITKIPIIWHYRMARVSLVLGFLHGILALSAYLGY